METRTEKIEAEAKRKGKNVWINSSGQQVFSKTRPEGDWAPDWPEHRVRGCRYTPYGGGSEWEEAANHSMSWAARDNFNR